MGQAWSALAAAAIGVVGTLGAALLTQSRADRLKRHELEALARQQREERDHAEQVRQHEAHAGARRELIDLRRACCISLNTAARQYQTAQINVMHSLRARDGAEIPIRGEQLEEQRQIYRERYAEAQMIVPSAVFTTVRTANGQLNRTYGLIKRLLKDGVVSDAQIDALEEETEVSWVRLTDLRNALRHDLGVDEAFV